MIYDFMYTTKYEKTIVMYIINYYLSNKMIIYTYIYLVPLQIPKFVVKIPLISAADIRRRHSFIQVSRKSLFGPIHLKVLSVLLIDIYTLYRTNRISAIHYRYDVEELRCWIISQSK